MPARGLLSLFVLVPVLVVLMFVLVVRVLGTDGVLVFVLGSHCLCSAHLEDSLHDEPAPITITMAPEATPRIG